MEIGVEAGRFELGLRQPGRLRPLSTAELSDGTLRYLLWAAARTLVSALDHAATELTTIELVKDLGETRVAGRERLDQPPWQWPKR